MTVGEKIKALRKQNKFTLSDLSKKVDLSISFLSDIENSRSNPSLVRLQSIAAALDTSVSYLMGEVELSKCPKLFEGDVEIKFKAYMKDSIFLETIELLSDYDAWSVDEKRELVAYLKVKSQVRS